LQSTPSRRGLLEAEHRDLAAYRAEGGYEALQRARSVGAADLIALIGTAGLRGRGGAGFPTADKWSVAAKQLSVPKHVIANCYDADPYSPISRTLLERSPHQIIEGALIASYVIGPSDVLIYVHPNADRAMQRANDAVRELERDALIAGTDVRVVVGPGGFMGGEETALIHALEGQRPMAGQRPPYPAQRGLGLKPTLIQSGETLATVPRIMRDGPAAYEGTKIFAVRAAEPEPTLVEAPLGAPLGDVLNRARVRLDGSRGVHVGGPTGGILPAEASETPLSFEGLAEAGTHMGSAQLRVLAKEICMVHFAADLFEYLAEETCGICVPCRVGTKRVDGILEGIYSGLGREEDLPWLAELATHMEEGSMCGFGITAPSILRTLTRYFADDVRAHLDGRCPTGTCTPARQRRYETLVQP
jgi:NADH:ubiquinone oxidoreductase subunit F (NADH-binding)